MSWELPLTILVWAGAIALIVWCVFVVVCGWVLWKHRKDNG